MEERRYNKWHIQLNKKDKGLSENSMAWFSEEYDDSGWDTIYLPKSFEGTDLEEIKGSIWFRKEIYLNEEPTKENVKLILGTLVDGDETYVNGVMVGDTEYRYPPRRYSFPGEILKKAETL